MIVSVCWPCDMLTICPGQCQMGLAAAPFEAVQDLYLNKCKYLLLKLPTIKVVKVLVDLYPRCPLHLISVYFSAWTLMSILPPLEFLMGLYCHLMVKGLY